MLTALCVRLCEFWKLGHAAWWLHTMHTRLRFRDIEDEVGILMTGYGRMGSAVGFLVAMAKVGEKKRTKF
jgi:hypothetical protein